MFDRMYKHVALHVLVCFDCNLMPIVTHLTFPHPQMELRQLQLQLTDLKFSGRKDEPEDWSPGHWAGYGQGSMGSYPMHVQWIGWIDECDVMWPLRLALTIAWSHGDSVTETFRFNWGKYYELPCLRGNGLVLRCFLWFEWRLLQRSLFDYNENCVCVLDFLGDDADPSPFEKETPSRIYKSGRVGVIIMFFLIQDELLPMKNYVILCFKIIYQVIQSDLFIP